MPSAIIENAANNPPKNPTLATIVFANPSAAFSIPIAVSSLIAPDTASTPDINPAYASGVTADPGCVIPLTTLVKLAHASTNPTHGNPVFAALTNVAKGFTVSVSAGAASARCP